MRLKFFYAALIILIANTASKSQYDIYKISTDIELMKLTENVFVHISYFTSKEYGRFPSNGMIYVQGNEAFLFDTPMTEGMTEQLISFIKDSLKLEITGFIPNHWHDDCTGGLRMINELNIESYSNILTYDILKEKNLPLTKYHFRDSLLLNFGKNKIICKYFGAAHAADNIIVWLPSEKVLFAGCMAKELSSKGLGNLSDADTKQWPVTIKTVFAEFPDAEYVIPGHGNTGSKELLEHTLHLLAK
ncbi:MAG: subclass B1 metallo-beta-lactamase [Ignavibacteriales bacterium]|nr:MAG: subclass B1 metallo-beta-lactamase [Ignavibacteriales bacterium]